jgi:pimeloyl-ACP methyl ester carboxylesterase
LKVSQAVFDALTEERWPRWPEMLAEVGYSPDTPADTRRRGAGIATCATGREQTELDFRAAAAWDGRARVGGLACPLLVVTGEHDLLTPPRWGEALAAAVPGSRLVSIRSAGHMPMHEKPDDLAGHLRDFAAGVAPRTR